MEPPRTHGKANGSTEEPLEIAIIGGGIAGLTLALGLIARGVTPTIYERGQSFREIGAGIGFTQNAEAAMKLLDQRIHDAFKNVTVQNGTDWFIWMDGSVENEGKVIHKMYLGERGFEGCARADFLDELVKSLPKGTVRFGRKLEEVVDTDGAGKIEIKFADGSTNHADIVIGCDGIRSRVRDVVVGDMSKSARYTYKYAFRGLIPMPTALAVLGREKTDTRHMYLGPDGHALTFPVAGGRLLNVVGFTTDQNPWPHTDRFTADASKSDAINAFQHFGPTVRSIVDMLPDELTKWAVFDTYDNPAPTFSKGRVCIAGDAAHAAAPYHGAGAGFAIEDGVVLAHLLAKLQEDLSRDSKTKAIQVEKALHVYSQVRLQRALWLVETSRYVGAMYEWQDPRVGSDHNKLADQIDWRCRRIWEYDVQTMVTEAVKQFETDQGR